MKNARERIRGRVRHTPTVPFTPLRDRLPCGVWLKLENLQVTGSFKPRGAVNHALSIPPEELKLGLLTASGGNHGLGVAYAGSLLSVPVTVYVPEKANQARRDRLARWGAEVIVEGRDWDDSYAAAVRDHERTKRPLIHPFNDPFVIAGQGTVGVELVEDGGVAFDAVVIAIGGGGLIAGVSLAIKSMSPKTRVIGVEPTGAASMLASVKANRLVELPEIRTIADTLSARRVGELTLELTQRYVDEIVLVDDAAMVRATKFLWNEFNLLVEPSAAASLAALLEEKLKIAAGSRVGIVVCGGNINAAPALDQFGI
ncbi:MAG: threonine/serine dehydratase [Acidobacteria bacterium]|nr:threonine/serine dehydratase [Acidobacteriota bacterium]